MQDIRILGLDLDGTVFDDRKEITPRTLAAMRAAIDRGVIVLPATGRPVSGVPEQFLHMQGVRYALTSNGATVTEPNISGIQVPSVPSELPPPAVEKA